MKIELLKKLGKYTTLAGATAMAGTANADIVYMDINPDTIFNTGTFDLDIDNDGTYNFRFAFIGNNTASGSAGVLPNGSSNSIVGYLATYSGNPYSYASALGTTNVISTANNFYSVQVILAGFAGTTSNWGQFVGANNQYVGVKFTNGGNIHFGWIRLDLTSGPFTYTIKDYAYNDILGASIAAGQMPAMADTAQMVMAADTANNLNPRDLEITFNMATDESTLSEYRVFIVKTANVGAIDLDSARNVTNYGPITPTGSASYSIAPDISGTDIDGDSIMQGVSYTAFVLSVPDGTNATNHSLVNSNPVTLGFAAGTASNLTASDVSNNYNSTDFNVAFDMAADESYISEYRVFVLKSASAGSFDLTAADTSLNYISIGPTGSNVSQVLPVTAVDFDGDAIVVDVPYKFFVYSAGTGGAANALSVASNEVILSKQTGGGTGFQSDLSSNINVFNNSEELVINTENGVQIGYINIININGTNVRSEMTSNSTQKVINISDLSSGMYFVEVETTEGSVIKKIVK